MMKATKARKRSGPTQFSKTLRSLMAERSLTIRQISDQIGVSPSTIDDWRAGAKPEDYIAVKRLAGHLGVSFAFLLTGEEDDGGRKSPPAIAEVFEDAGELFDGYLEVKIKRLIPRTRREK